jgi:hypothetical protein
LEFSEVEKMQTDPNDDVEAISKRLIQQNYEAYKELAK